MPIHNFDTSQPVDDGVPVLTCRGYALDGEEVDGKSPKCLARFTHEEKANHDLWEVRVTTCGPESGLLCNPFSPLYNQAGLTRDMGWNGRKQYDFQAVPKACFELYLKFLQTRNQAYIRQAETVRI